MGLKDVFFQSKNRVRKGSAQGRWSISNLSIEQKGDIVALRQDGMLPSDIANEVGCTGEQVTKVLQLEKRKQDRLAGNESYGDDPVKKKRQEIELRKAEAELKKVEWELEDKERQRQLREAQQFIPGDDDEEEDTEQDMLSNIMQMLIIKQMGGSAGGFQSPLSSGGTVSPAQVPLNQKVKLNEQEIQGIIDAYPEHAKGLQKMPDSVIKKTIGHNYPMLDEETLDLAVQVLKKKSIKVKA